MLTLDAARLCEFVAHWMGGTTLPEVGRLLGYTSRRVQTLVEDGFARRGPATVRYDAGSKRWRSSVPSKDLHGPRSAQEVVAALQAMRLWSRGTEAERLFPLVDTRVHRTGPAPDTFRTLLGACVRRQVVDVVYLARTRELAVSFSPHTLVVTPHREHFRGYSAFESEGESHYWDLVPSRVVSAEVRPRSGYVDAGGDAEWHAEEELRLRLKADLPDAMRQALRHEHGLIGDRIEVGRVRRALLRYVADDYLNRRYGASAVPAWEIISGAEAAGPDG